MKSISNISVPQPCTQNWDSMLPNTTGSFCNSCQKTVIDFTQLSNTEILDILSASQKVCGRFNETQLLVLNHEIAPRHSLFSWQKISLAAAFIVAVPFTGVQAKVKPVMEQGPLPVKNLTAVSDTNVVYKRITGKVTDGKDGIIGATVRIKGKQIASATDVNGNFVLNAPVSKELTLVVLYIGFDAKEVKIDPAKSTAYNVELKAMPGLMGEVVIARRPPLLLRPWYRFKRTVHKIFS